MDGNRDFATKLKVEVPLAGISDAEEATKDRR
jgi:hypothetical protein